MTTDRLKVEQNHKLHREFFLKDHILLTSWENYKPRQSEGEKRILHGATVAADLSHAVDM